jgi:hypothetical protein
VRVEPGERRRGGENSRRAELSVGGSFEVSTADGASGREESVAEEESGTEPADHDEHGGRLLDDRSDSGDPCQDQGQVGASADRNDQQHMVTTQTLAQLERVLGADRHDQRQSGHESRQGRSKHHTTVGSRTPSGQFKFVMHLKISSW